jgi:cagE trbE virB component of type IV transporter system
MGNIGFGDYLSNIMVFDKDLDKAEEDARYISGVISACGFSAKTETHNTLQAFCAMMPGNIYADSRSLFCSTGNLSHVIPTTSIWAGIKNNTFMDEIAGNKRPLLVCATEFGILYFLNLNVKDVGHTWISGPTGSGKSTLLALLESQFLKYHKAKVIIFDKDKSARNLTMCVGGTYIEPGKDETTFAPLATLDTPEDIRWASDFIEILLAEQHIPITPAMRKVIYNTVKLLATKTSGRDLTSFAQYCQYQNPETGHNDIVDGIAPYILGGQFANLFDSSEEAHIPITDWTMVEMGSLMNMSASAVAPSLFYLFHECEKKFDGSPTLLVLDEAWTFLKNPIFAQKIVEWLKTLRKKHVFVVFATQETDDAARSAIASTIVSQCPTKIFLADNQAETKLIRDSYRNFGLEDSEIHLLTQMIPKHDYFYKSPLGTRRFQLDLDALQLAILTGDHALLDTIEQKYGRNSGRALVEEILRAKHINYTHLLEA